MAVFDNSYSRMIAWLKILLPLAALAILSTLFLASNSTSPTLTLAIPDEEVRELASKPKIGSPTFSGVAANGVAITLSAEAAEPLADAQTGLRVSGMSGVFESPDGSKIDISAQSGVFDTSGQSASLTGGVFLTTSNGYEISTDGIVTDLETSTVSTDGSISAVGPLGKISAGKLTIRQKDSPETGNPYELVFQDGVSLIYVPRQ